MEDYSGGLFCHKALYADFAAGVVASPANKARQFKMLDSRAHARNIHSTYLIIEN